MSRERQRHGLAAPIIAAAAPLFRTGALRLRRVTVVEEEPGIPFERIEPRLVRKNERRGRRSSLTNRLRLHLFGIEQRHV